MRALTICIILFTGFLVGCSRTPKFPVSDIDTLQDAYERTEAASTPARNRFGDESEIGKPCETNADCALPMGYAIQSNCPYQSFCHSDRCVVVCPLYYHSPETSESVSYQVQCEADSDCDCLAQRAAGTFLSCNCLSGQCVAVVAQ